MTYDIAIVGGGIVGLATARALLERAPGLSLVICEKESALGMHQTGHNSGVIHSGIYYKPGSYKARLCVEGARLMTEFCDAHGIKYDRCGKLIVATSSEEVARLRALFERGTANGVPGLAMIDAARAREIEPHVSAVAAIHSPSTAIVDFGEVAARLGRELAARGVAIELDFPVSAITRVKGGGLAVSTRQHTVMARHLVNCAGLYSDVVARLAGAAPDVRIVPFRGEYYMIRPERESLVRGLIYPVPDPEFPFLGVHFTRTIHGGVEAGPNAVLAFAREGYRFARVRPDELAGTLGYRGFWSMARRYWRTGAYEMYRSLSKKAFVRALQRLVPDVTAADLVPGGAGVRAQAVTREGMLVDDFRIVTGPDSIHVLNAPSPAATASLAIGRHIASLAAETFSLR
ncbi:MAG TPA: L-2-hydroxyglutarate oxidase [Candidatus Tectomicrobia bacterium]|nr:L-2-hydroxyglutarate oxidase [Candidatus Tectomicrobia bacterium]